MKVFSVAGIFPPRGKIEPVLSLSKGQGALGLPKNRAVRVPRPGYATQRLHPWNHDQ
jgi:hypothetical protein